MSEEFWNHTARLPRHRATDDTKALVVIKRSAQPEPNEIPAELCDISRHGIHAELNQELTENEPVVVHIRDGESDLDFSFPATVRWQHVHGDAKWQVGCLFDRQLSWETYGELFLNGILETELPAGDENK